MHLCIVTEDIQMILNLLEIDGLLSMNNNLRRFPAEYDQNTLNNWVRSSRGSIVVVVAPNKKDMQFLEIYLNGTYGNSNEVSQFGITFWVICEVNPKK